MKNILLKMAMIVVAIIMSFNIKAQCPPGETEVTIQFTVNNNYYYYYYYGLIQWDFIAGGLVSGNGPYNENDVITTCVPDGDLIIVGCDEQYGFGWFAVDFTVTITEDGSINGCGAQDGCVLYIGDDSNIPYIESCNFGPGFPSNPVVQLEVGPCDASPILTEGCTDPIAPNYNACATTDDGSCLIPTVNDNCADAIPIVVEPPGSCPANSILVNNTANTFEYASSCGNPNVDLFYTFTVPPSGAVNIDINPIDFGVVSVSILDVCNGTEYYCNYFVFNENVGGLPPGEELILHLSQYNPGNFELCLQEAPPPPPNDICENAVPICGALNGNNLSATTDINDPLTSCVGFLDNTVWYSFEADGSGDPITINITQGDCGYGYYFFNVLQTHILSGTCGGPYTEEDCSNGYDYYYYYPPTGEYTLTLSNPVAGVSYFVYIDGSGFECNFTIEPSGGIQACCGPDFLLAPTCQLGDDTGFYVDIQVDDIGDNPSGYSINGGAFPDITSTGTFTVGPFPNGTTTITIEGLDDASCVITREIEFDCTCDPLAVTTSEDGLICAGENFEATAVLEDVIPGGFTGNYIVTTDPAGSCTAVPTGAVTEVALSDDDFSGPIPFGFDFDYWENTYADFYIGSNGYVTFGSGSTNLGNDPIPSTDPPNNIIALFWTDLWPADPYYYYPPYPPYYYYFGGSGTVSYYNATVGGQNCMVVEFDEVTHYPGYGNPTISGQIIMCEDGTITINCIDCPPDFDTPTSGIENSDGTAGFFDPALNNGQYTGAGSYMACTTFTPEATEPAPCDFLYWVTDLNDPAGSVVSTEETATFSPVVTTTYYAVVECENAILCVDEVTVTIDDPANCGGCADEIAGSVQTNDPDCSIDGIMVLITDSNGNPVGIAITDANGDYILPGGSFPCGEYIATLDIASVPACYLDAEGDVGPKGFTVNGDGISDGADFSSFDEVPTLSQWGLMILALLMMSFGAIKLLHSNRLVRQI